MSFDFLSLLSKEKLNGILVTECKDYTISEMSGVGEDDFSGIGAAVMVADKGPPLAGKQ